MKLSKIKCDYCGEVFEFEDDGITADCMPDGWLLPTHEWLCLDCGSCPECRCVLGTDWEYRDFSNKTIAVCPQCKHLIYLEVS